MSDIPEKIGKYDVVDVLGKGSMGIVYRGHDAYVDRPVAIKLATNTDASEDGESMAKRMFVNEARSAGRLDHVNILKVYEAGEEHGPGGTFFTGDTEHAVGEALSAAAVFNHRAEDGPDSHDGGDEAKAGSHAIDNSLADIGHVHRPRCEANEDAGDEQGDEGLDPELKDEDEDERDGGNERADKAPGVRLREDEVIQERVRHLCLVISLRKWTAGKS